MQRVKLLKLDERLSLCASFVREKKMVADIGTDHAYLPVYLVKSGKTNFAVAADVRVGPLENAAGNIAENGLSDRIKTVLSDGLDKISPEETDDIVIAGMGGELIARIIEDAPWLKNSEKHLILQPMTRAEELRSYLSRSGFRIISEKACISCKKCYSVMLCEYDGIIRECSDLYRYIGDLVSDESIEAGRYIYIVTEKLKKKIKGFGRDTSEYESLSSIITQLEQITAERNGNNDISIGNI